MANSYRDEIKRQTESGGRVNNTLYGKAQSWDEGAASTKPDVERLAQRLPASTTDGAMFDPKDPH